MFIKIFKNEIHTIIRYNDYFNYSVWKCKNYTEVTAIFSFSKTTSMKEMYILISCKYLHIKCYLLITVNQKSFYLKKKKPFH